MELPSQPSVTVEVPSSNYGFRANFLDAKVCNLFAIINHFGRLFDLFNGKFVR